jgi:hypothetical protein
MQNSNAQKLCKIQFPPITAHKTLFLFLFDSAEGDIHIHGHSQHISSKIVCQYSLIMLPQSQYLQCIGRCANFDKFPGGQELFAGT